MRLARMAFFQSFGLANAPRRNASSGENVNVKGLSAQSGNWRVVPSARRNGFQFFGAAAGLGLGISFDWLLIVLSNVWLTGGGFRICQSNQNQVKSLMRASILRQMIQKFSFSMMKFLRGLLEYMTKKLGNIF